ncbi:MAG: hypothetical protein NTZ85_01225 [Bacteroidia bacterium]|nr:hypothetical protein [Bacteroidia bacterium]
MHILITRILCLAILLSGIFHSASGADTLQVANSKLYFDNLPLTNIWANSTNPAGLTFCNSRQISLVEAGYSFSKKELKSPVEPGLINSFYAKTRGYKKIGKLTFFGSFGYDNEQYRDLLYNNTLVFDTDNPYILGDTIGGKQNKEGFLLEGAAAYPINERISIGIDVDYQNYVGSKQKDPRNRNDISSFTITPGLIYNGSKISAGISAGPLIFNNDISISVMDDGKYNLFQFLGFGYFKSIRNITSYENTYFGKGYQTEVQLRYRKESYSNFLVVNYKNYIEEVRYGNTKRLIDGISGRDGFSACNYQSFRKNDNLHQLNIFFHMMNLDGTEVMQHSKTIIAGLYTYDTLITDSWVEGKHIVSNYDGTIEYIFTRYNKSREKYRVNLSVTAGYQSAYHYPVQNYGFQEILNLLVYSGYKTYLKCKSLAIVPEFGIGYRKNLSKSMNYVVTPLSIPELQEQDYITRHSDLIKANAGVTLLKRTNNKSLSEYFLNLNTTYTYFPGSDSGGKNNIFLIGSVGLIF